MPDTAATPASLAKGALAPMLETIPEPTSYNGRFHLELPIPADLFLASRAAGPGQLPPAPGRALFAPASGPGVRTCLRPDGKLAGHLQLRGEPNHNAGLQQIPERARLMQALSARVTLWFRPYGNPGTLRHIATFQWGTDHQMILVLSEENALICLERRGQKDAFAQENWKSITQLDIARLLLTPDGWYRIRLETDSTLDLVADPANRTWVCRGLIEGKSPALAEQELFSLSERHLPSDLTLGGDVLLSGSGHQGMTAVAGCDYAELAAFAPIPAVGEPTATPLVCWPMDSFVPANPGARGSDALTRFLAHCMPGDIKWPLLFEHPDYQLLNPTVVAIDDGVPVEPAVASPTAAVAAPVAAPAARVQDCPDPETAVKAVIEAQTTGVLPASLFPYAVAGRTTVERDDIAAALRTLDLGEVRRQYARKNHLTVLRNGMSGRMKTGFTSAGVAHRPRLLLILETRLTSYPTRLGPGRVVKTLSLLPGESTTISMRSYRRSAVEIARTSSILDSFNSNAASDFESRLEDESSAERESSHSESYYADMNVDLSWGWGSGSVDAGVKAGGKWDIAGRTAGLSRKLSNSVAHHSHAASSRRDVQIDTTTKSTSEAEDSESIERHIENINVGAVLNFVFTQLNQEIASITHLTGLKLAYFDGSPDSVDEVAVVDFWQLLTRHLDVTEKDADGKRRIDGVVADLLQAIGDLAKVGTLPDGTVTAPKGPSLIEIGGDGTEAGREGGPMATITVNPLAQTTLNLAGGKRVTVDGQVLSLSYHVMRTDSVVADSFLSEGAALDGYSAELQAETTRSLRLKNDLLERALAITGTAADADAATRFAGLLDKLAGVIGGRANV